MKEPSRNIVCINDVIGKQITGLGQKTLGRVEELVFDKLTGQVRYVVLSYGEFMSTGSELYAIPWFSLEYCTEHDAFKVNFSKDDLKQAIGFNKDSWPNFADVLWTRATDEFYNHFIQPKSPMASAQQDFISEGGNSQPLHRDM